MHGFATGTTEVTTERREWREQTPPFSLPVGEARRRGGGTIFAAAMPPPEYDGIDGRARPWVGLVGGVPHGVWRAGDLYHFITMSF